MANSRFQSLALAVLVAAAWRTGAAAGDDGFLNALLDNAAPGDVIETGPVAIGEVKLRNYSFTPPITIKFDDASSIKRLVAREVTGVIFDGVNVRAGQALKPGGGNAVIMLGGGDISFVNASFQWSADNNPMNDGTALAIDGVKNVSIADSEFSHAFNGVVIRGSENVTVHNSTFTKIPKDGIVISGSSYVVLDGNECFDFTAAPGKSLHPDCIQLQAGRRSVANTNVTITNNKAVRGNGARFQGIFVKSKYDSAPHVGITIEENYVEQSMGLGIAVINATGVIVRGNEVRPANAEEEAPRILVRDPSSNVTVENNLAAGVKAPAHAVVRNNIIVKTP